MGQSLWEGSDSHQAAADGVYAVDDALPLCWAGFLHAVCVVAELALVDARSAADGREGDLRKLSNWILYHCCLVARRRGLFLVIEI